jgi:pimeloyl-ACP methyl ester carboxylesterase
MSGPQALDRMKNTVPDLRGVHLLDGAGHFVQQERADEVNELLISFLQGL